MKQAFITNIDRNGNKSYQSVYIKEIQEDGTAIIVDMPNSETPVGVNSKRLVNLEITPFIFNK